MPKKKTVFLYSRIYFPAAGRRPQRVAFYTDPDAELQFYGEQRLIQAMPAALQRAKCTTPMTSFRLASPPKKHVTPRSHTAKDMAISTHAHDTRHETIKNNLSILAKRTRGVHSVLCGCQWSVESMASRILQSMKVVDSQRLPTAANASDV